MDCYEPVDDYCDAWQAEHLQIPEKIPSTDINLDQFFILLEIETTFPSTEDDDDDDCDDHQFVQVEDTNIQTFWAPCPRTERGNLTRDRISGMLSGAGVPLHKQAFMVDRISARADEIANAAYNRDTRVIPMIVSISIVACLCFGETVDDY